MYSIDGGTIDFETLGFKLAAGPNGDHAWRLPETSCNVWWPVSMRMCPYVDWMPNCLQCVPTLQGERVGHINVELQWPVVP